MSTEKAYGKLHERTRKALLPKAYGQPCPICHLPMQRYEPLDLGHSTHERKVQGLPGDRIEHAACNRRDGRGGTPLIPAHLLPSPSREW